MHKPYSEMSDVEYILHLQGKCPGCKNNTSLVMKRNTRVKADAPHNRASATSMLIPAWK